MSTRIIGGIIMTHGDNSGLVLPPAVAPIQVIILPIAQHKPGVLDKAYELRDRLKKAGIRGMARQTAPVSAGSVSTRIALIAAVMSCSGRCV